MGQNNRKVRNSFTIVMIVLTLILSYGIYYFGKNNLKLDKKYNSVINDLSIVNNKIKDNDNSSSIVLEKIDYLNNIDNLISEKQKNVYKLSGELEQKIRSGSSKYKIAYLTFDDGPYYNTFNVFNVLKKYDVKATFFTTNTNGNQCWDNKSYNCQDIYPYYIKYGHTLANHTFTHSLSNNAIYRSEDRFRSELTQQADLIKSKTNGYTPNIMRFPGGSAQPRFWNLGSGNEAKLKKLTYSLGYGWVDWTANDGDGNMLNSLSEGRNTFYPTINENIEVVLFHDYDKYTTQLLPEFIEYLQSKNYILLPLFYESVMVTKS